MTCKFIDKFLEPIKNELPFFILNTLLLSIYTLPDVFLRLDYSLYQRVGWLVFIPAFPVLWSYLWCYAFSFRRLHNLKWIVYLLSVFLLVVNVFLRMDFETSVSSWILLLLWETTGRESSEFLSDYALSSGALCGYSIIAASAILIYVMEKWLPRHIGKIGRWSAAVFIAVYGTTGIYQTALMGQMFFTGSQSELEDWYSGQGYYAIENPINNLLFSAYQLSISAGDNGRAVTSCVEAAKVNAGVVDNDSLNVVVIIGESYNKHHSHLYGYRHDTTPFMDAERDAGRLFAFQDVVSPYNMTTLAVKNIMSVNSLACGEHWYEKPIFPLIFKKAGFNVCYWDNQKAVGEVTFYDFSISSFMFNDKVARVSYNATNDSVSVLDGPLVKSLFTSFKAKKRNLLMLHLMGQHSMPACRFPNTPEYTKFSASDYKYRRLSKDACQYIADYDNATYYNDCIIKDVVKRLEGTNTVVVYFPDHGDEVYDYRNFFGRTHEKVKTAQSLTYQYEIPFVVWCSDKYMQKHTATVKRLASSINRPFMTDNVAHLLFSLGGIKTPYYKATKDLIGPHYHCGRRIVQDLCDYDRTMLTHRK